MVTLGKMTVGTLAGAAPASALPTTTSPGALLTIEGLMVDFNGVQVLRGIDLMLEPGEGLDIVGESGSGKSVTWLAALGLLPKTASVSGAVRLDGEDLLTIAQTRLDRVRGGRVAMIFQDPSSALNPVIRIGRQIGEVLARHQGLSGSRIRAEAKRLFDLVGIPDAARRLDCYPHELSGGQNQRVMIAMALAGKPDVLDTRAWRRLRAQMQMMYQDPLAALDRRLAILDQVREPLDIHDIGATSERGSKALAMLEAVGSNTTHAASLPSQLSGGQRQRVVLARALIMRPALLVCDEPVSARRLDPGAGCEPAHGPAAGPTSQSAVHQSRPESGSANQPADGRQITRLMQGEGRPCRKFARSAAIDLRVRQLEAQGIKGPAIADHMFGYIAGLQRIYDTASDETLIDLSRRYPGFHHYAALMEALSEKNQAMMEAGTQ